MNSSDNSPFLREYKTQKRNYHDTITIKNTLHSPSLSHKLKRAFLDIELELNTKAVRVIIEVRRNARNDERWDAILAPLLKDIEGNEYA